MPKSQLKFFNSFQIINEKGLPFKLFSIDCKNNLYLTQLSFIRNHGAQASLMFRKAIESATLASYGLHVQDMNAFGKITDDNTIDIDQKVSNEAYKWIEKNYSIESNYLKMKKNLINSNFSHSNIFAASGIFQYENWNENIETFFDKETESGYFIKVMLCTLADFSCFVTNFFMKLSNEYSSIITFSENDKFRFKNTCMKVKQTNVSFKNSKEFSRIKKTFTNP